MGLILSENYMETWYCYEKNVLSTHLTPYTKLFWSESDLVVGEYFPGETEA